MQASFKASISAAVKLNHLPMLLHLLYLQSLLSSLNLLGRTTDFLQWWPHELVSFCHLPRALNSFDQCYTSHNCTPTIHLLLPGQWGGNRKNSYGHWLECNIGNFSVPKYDAHTQHMIKNEDPRKFTLPLLKRSFWNPQRNLISFFLTRKMAKWWACSNIQSTVFWCGRCSFSDCIPNYLQLDFQLPSMCHT